MKDITMFSVISIKIQKSTWRVDTDCSNFKLHDQASRVAGPHTCFRKELSLEFNQASFVTVQITQQDTQGQCSGIWLIFLLRPGFLLGV